MSCPWDPQPLQAYENLTRLNGQTINGRIYTGSIQNKLNIIYLLETRIKSYFLVKNSGDFNQKRLLLTIDLESVLYNLNSISDILACIINHWIILPTTQHLEANSNSLIIRQDQQTLYNVKSVLEKLNNRFSLPNADTSHFSIDSRIQTIINECKNLVTTLVDSSYFQYIRDFVNTVKHSQTIDSSWTGSINSSGINFDWQINSFDTYDSNGNIRQSHNCLSVTQFVNVYYPDVHNQFMIIGNKVNDFCNRRQSLNW